MGPIVCPQTLRVERGENDDGKQGGKSCVARCFHSWNVDPSLSRTYLSYDSVRDVGQQPHLSHLNETVLDEYEEEAEE